jgi:hypothetical protein
MIFDPARHEYRDGEERILSVTQVLKRAGLIDDRWYTEEARDRGSAVHKFCQIYAEGIRHDRQGRELAGLQYVAGLARWMEETRAYAIHTERMIENTLNGYRYAGTYDLLAEIHGARILIDYKTGPAAHWHPAQIAAYSLAEKPRAAGILYLRADKPAIERRLSGSELLHAIDAFKRALEKAHENPQEDDL